MKILAIESTCDETAAAVVENIGLGVRVLISVVASSIAIQEKYGGIIPELAAREQVKSIIPVIKEALGEIKMEEIDAIAASFGPGLMGSLLIGVETAKTLAWVFNKPLLSVNHVGAHLMGNWIINPRNQGIKESRTQDDEVPEMPAIGLIASGGHTDFVYMKSVDDWEWIGGTRDDAVGEAFDKAARAFGLPYPGGPEIDKRTKSVTNEEYSKLNKKDKLPRPLINDDSLEMSFSGLKAAVTRVSSQFSDIRSQKERDLYVRDFSEAVTEILIKKLNLAMDKYSVKSVLLAGGVAANSKIREEMRKTVESRGLKFFVPELKYCGDNAAMIGACALLKPITASTEISPDPGMGII